MVDAFCDQVIKQLGDITCQSTFQPSAEDSQLLSDTLCVCKSVRALMYPSKLADRTCLEALLEFMEVHPKESQIRLTVQEAVESSPGLDYRGTYNSFKNKKVQFRIQSSSH